MLEVRRETKNHKTYQLYESKMLCVQFVQCKENKEYDRVKFIRYGDRYNDSEITVIYRYEDRQLFDDISRMYKELE